LMYSDIFRLMENSEKQLLINIAGIAAFLLAFLVIMIIGVSLGGFPYPQLAATIVVGGLLWSIYAIATGLQKAPEDFTAGGRTRRLSICSLFLNGIASVIFFFMASVY
jgi:hypothetical protein